MAHGHIELSGGVGFDGTLTAELVVRAEGVASTETQTSSLGLLVTKTYKITASPLTESDGGSYHWELRDSDGNRLADGLGDALTDVLLGFAVDLESGAPDNPTAPE